MVVILPRLSSRAAGACPVMFLNGGAGATYKGATQKYIVTPFVDWGWLYGSRARGTSKDRSDIDLAIVCPHQATIMTGCRWKKLSKPSRERAQQAQSRYSSNGYISIQPIKNQKVLTFQNLSFMIPAVYAKIELFSLHIYRLPT